jgi:hypothetical protein
MRFQRRGGRKRIVAPDGSEIARTARLPHSSRLRRLQNPRSAVHDPGGSVTVLLSIRGLMQALG